MSKARLMQGNEACAEGAIAAGVNFFAGYPITPSTEIAETMAKLLPQHGGKFVQMEDEIASMGAILGASLAGAKAMDATSGPGFSLKQELIGYAACAEIPCVLVDVQRVGPSTGQPTAPSQADVMQARWGTHGDHPIIALAPWSVRETYDVTVMAVNYAERFRTPVILLMDEVVGHLREKVVLPDHVDVYPRRQPKKTRAEGYEPFTPDEDLVPNVADFGKGYHIHVTGLIHDDTGFPVGSPAITEQSIRRLHEKIDRAGEEIFHTECSFMDDAEYAVVAFGGTARTAYEAVRAARARREGRPRAPHHHLAVRGQSHRGARAEGQGHPRRGDELRPGRRRGAPRGRGRLPRRALRQVQHAGVRAAGNRDGHRPVHRWLEVREESSWKEATRNISARTASRTSGAPAAATASP